MLIFMEFFCVIMHNYRGWDFVSYCFYVYFFQRNMTKPSSSSSKKHCSTRGCKSDKKPSKLSAMRRILTLKHSPNIYKRISPRVQKRNSPLAQGEQVNEQQQVGTRQVSLFSLLYVSDGIFLYNYVTFCTHSFDPY